MRQAHKLFRRSTRQTRTRLRVDGMVDLWQSIKRYDNRPADKLPECVYVDDAALNTILISVLRARRESELPAELRRVGIARISIARAMGDRAWLRKARRGFERGVRRPYTANDMKIYAATRDMADRGYSQRRMLRELIRKGLWHGQRRSSFQKLLKK